MLFDSLLPAMDLSLFARVAVESQTKSAREKTHNQELLIKWGHRAAING